MYVVDEKEQIKSLKFGNALKIRYNRYSIGTSMNLLDATHYATNIEYNLELSPLRNVLEAMAYAAIEST